MRFKVKTLTETCSSCPSQWEGETDDGDSIDISCRHGVLNFSVSSFKASLGVKSSHDETMSYEEMTNMLSSTLDFSECTLRK